MTNHFCGTNTKFCKKKFTCAPPWDLNFSANDRSLAVGFESSSKISSPTCLLCFSRVDGMDKSDWNPVIHKCKTIASIQLLVSLLTIISELLFDESLACDAFLSVLDKFFDNFEPLLSSESSSTGNKTEVLLRRLDGRWESYAQYSRLRFKLSSVFTIASSTMSLNKDWTCENEPIRTFVELNIKLTLPDYDPLTSLRTPIHCYCQCYLCWCAIERPISVKNSTKCPDWRAWNAANSFAAPIVSSWSVGSKHCLTKSVTIDAQPLDRNLKDGTGSINICVVKSVHIYTEHTNLMFDIWQNRRLLIFGTSGFWFDKTGCSYQSRWSQQNVLTFLFPFFELFAQTVPLDFNLLNLVPGIRHRTRNVPFVMFWWNVMFLLEMPKFTKKKLT